MKLSYLWGVNGWSLRCRTSSLDSFLLVCKSFALTAGGIVCVLHLLLGSANYGRFSLDVTKIQTTKLLILLRFYLYNCLLRMGSCFCDILSFCVTQHFPGTLTWRPRELSCWLKNVTYFGEFDYLNSSCIKKSIILMFLSSLRDKFILLVQTQWQIFLLVSGRHVGAHLGGVSIQISINLGKMFLCMSYIRKIADLNLGESLCIFAFFLFSDSELYLLNGSDFYFDLFWMAWNWNPAIKNFANGAGCPRVKMQWPGSSVC